MFPVLALALTVVASPVVASPVEHVTPQCTYSRYVVAGIWSALDDAERHGESKLVTNNLENTLRDATRRQREACNRG